jgi:small-conductance mechanosensitive channel
MRLREIIRYLRALTAARIGARMAVAMLALAAVVSVAAGAHGASPTVTQTSAASPAATASAARESAAKPFAAPTNAAEAPLTTPQGVLGYLSGAINWYRQLSTQAQLVEQPDETVFYTEDRQTAIDILQLGFDYARGVADFLGKSAAKKSGPSATHASLTGASAGLNDLNEKLAALQAEVTDAQARLKKLQAQSAQARGAQRATLASQMQAVQGEIDLAQARADALSSIVQFQTGTSAPEQAAGLRGQIDELEKSIPELESNAAHSQTQTAATPTTAANTTATPAPAPVLQSSQPTGMGVIFDLFEVRRRLDVLDQIQTGTNAFISQVKAAREPYLQRIIDLDERGAEFAKNTSTSGSDAAMLRGRKKDFDALIEEHKALVAASLPLTKQLVLLDVYTSNLDRWRASLGQRMRADIRSLSIRVAILAFTLLLIAGVAILWKQLTFRYVKDIRRRGQVLAARRFVVGILVLLVILINFADQLGSFATILGFAAAGVAVALQNVILSIAGYFFLIGRFGIKVGDRVQIGGVTGDVVEIGLVKLSLMELGGGGGNHLQPTGRVVVYSNAIVFQPNGNFFKQAPGTHFVWNEIRLTLAPDADYRLIEKRLTDAVDQVFARYREQVQRDYRHLERDLNILLESPKPQSRMSLSAAGLEVIIRYPAETRNSSQIADEVTRRVLDAIAREPSLRLVTGTANIQAVVPPAAPEGAAAESEKESA